MAVPSSHIEEGLKITADSEIILYEISLKNVSGGTAFLRFRDGPMGSSTVWNNKTWEHLACQSSGDSRSADGEKSRPTIRLVNPIGIFNEPAFEGRFDGAILQKFMVLRAHLEAGLFIANNEVWFVGRVKELIAGQSISFELRALSDGPNHLIPARMYIPPDFPFVTL